MAVWVVAMVAVALSVAWLIERRHILTLRMELDAWGADNQSAKGAE